MSRKYVIASHAHFAAGIYESLCLLAGERDDVYILNAFVDGNDDIASAAVELVDSLPCTDDVVVCTDLFGGSVNNEFTKLMLSRPNVYLMSNMNLPLLLTLFFADAEEDTDALLRKLAHDDSLHSVYCNDAVSGVDTEDEDF